MCQRLSERGLIAGQDGNVSARAGRDRILVTPSGMSKADVRRADLVELGIDGSVSRGAIGKRTASSEVLMHLRIYERRPDVCAVVHAHPPVATGFGVAGESFMTDVLPELILLTGPVPLVPYAMPGTLALSDALEPYLAAHDTFLLANHGATAVGPNLVVACQRMESLEHAATIMLTARLLGRVNTLSTADAAALHVARTRARGAALTAVPRRPARAGSRRDR